MYLVSAPGSTNQVLSHFENFLKSADAEGKETLLVGDINCDLSTTLRDPLRTTLLQFLYEAYQFRQLITDYSRITEHSRTLIDHLITNKPQNIIQSGVVKINVSDHYLIFGIHKVQQTKSGPKYVEDRNMKNFDPNVFLQDLQNIQWDFSETDNPNDMVYIRETLFLEVVNRHAPASKRRIRNRPAPWLTPSIRVLMHKRDYLESDC